ncbi:hypothetical protein DFJ73DRAFT_761825 [Zopfochytrium polystomum]|nr:hypothetical protein DFJ73DRAFT_761825 [Zopfochytrium polystomum]
MAAIPEESVDSARSTSLSAVTLSGSVSPDLEGLIRSASEFDHDGGDSSSTNRSLYPTVVGNLLNRKPSISSTSNQNDPMSITKNSGDAAADYRCSSGTPADSPLISHTSSVKAESEEPEDVIPASGVGVLQRRLSELSLRPPVFTLPSTMSGSTMFSNDIESSMMSLISEEQQLGVVDPIGDSEFSLVHKLEAMVGNPEGVNSGAEVDDILSDMVSMSRQGKRTRVPSVTTTASVKMFRSSEDRSNDMAQSDFSQALFEFAALTKRMGGSEVMFDLSKPEDDAEQPPNPASWTSDSSGLNFPFVANSHSLPFHENIGGISSFADNQLDLPGTFPSVLAPAPAKFLPAFPSVSQVSVRPDSTVYSSITPAALSSPFAKSSATPPASENPPLVFHVYRQQTQVSGKTLKSSLVEPMSGALDRNKAPEPPFRSLTPQPHEVILQPSPVRLSDQNSSRQKRQNLRRHIATPNRPSSTPVFGTESTRPGSPLTRPSSPVTNGSLGTASAMAMPAAVLPGMPTIPTGVVEKKPYFKCPKPYCSKIYKNANGLRYHLERGNCEIESDADGDIIAVVKAAAAVRMSSLSASTSSSLDPKQESKVDDDDVVGDGSSPMLFSQPGDAEVPSVPHDLKIAHRPYWCRVSGCGRKYKNLNGLKYHGRVAHPEMSFREEVKGHASVRL